MAGTSLLMPETDLLQLNGRVINFKTGPNNVAKTFKNLMSIIGTADHDMAAHGVDS